jgi:hypothetical protein
VIKNLATINKKITIAKDCSLIESFSKNILHAPLKITVISNQKGVLLVIQKDLIINLLT